MCKGGILHIPHESKFRLRLQVFKTSCDRFQFKTVHVFMEIRYYLMNLGCFYSSWSRTEQSIWTLQTRLELKFRAQEGISVIVWELKCRISHSTSTEEEKILANWKLYEHTGRIPKQTVPVSARYGTLLLLLDDSAPFPRVNHKFTACILPVWAKFPVCVWCNPGQAASGSWCTALPAQPEPSPCESKHQNSAGLCRGTACHLCFGKSSPQRNTRKCSSGWWRTQKPGSTCSICESAGGGMKTKGSTLFHLFWIWLLIFEVTGSGDWAGGRGSETSWASCSHLS